MNWTAIIITAIVCTTVLAICFTSRKNKEDE